MVKMSQSTNSKTLGAVEDQTSIGLAKVASNMAPELEVNIVKATSHDDDPVDEKYICRILNLTSYCHGYVHACVSALSKRLSKTHDYIVALKSLVVIHRLLNGGDPIFHVVIMYATRRGARLLSLAVLLDKFFDVEYHDCVKALDAYASATKQIDELIAAYNWCKDTGVARSSEYPEVQRIASKLLETLEEFVRDRAKRPKSPERKEELPLVAQEEEPVPDMNEIKALPPPENYTPVPPPEPKLEPPKPQVREDLVDLRDSGVTADDQGNKFALALFAGPPANRGNGSWEASPSNGEPKVTSAWQTPAAESGKEDWELAFLETASNLLKQKAVLGGGLDPLLLNGMCDQGMVRQHVSTAQLTGGSASSIALPGFGKSATPILALHPSDGTVQTVNRDPFAASLSIPPPSYVQMAEMEKTQIWLCRSNNYGSSMLQRGCEVKPLWPRLVGQVTMHQVLL